MGGAETMKQPKQRSVRRHVSLERRAHGQWCRGVLGARRTVNVYLRVCSANTTEICKSGGVAVGVPAATSRPLPAHMYRK